jgi:MFS family permease
MLPTFINRLSLSGLAATLIGNGIGRFAFIAMMPALIQAGWFTQGQASQLSVATLVGYVVGAWVCERLVLRFGAAAAIRGSMALCSLSFFACAVGDAGMAWYLSWRTLAGVGGAVLMVVPAPLVLPLHPPEVRGRVSGMVFCGVGLGAVVSGALVPMLVAVLGGSATELFMFKGVTGAWRL